MSAELARLRAEIERIDRALVGLIRDRVSAARCTAAAKRAAGLPTVDPPQEATVIRRASALAREVGLPSEDVRDVFWKVVALTRRAELDG
ncbi:MAG TPA: chorismate mutase [Gemmatimonadales bacterium]|jgi:chorismate mutase|nr:chorismate mutase [Gemmatimonadales bacterium]